MTALKGEQTGFGISHQLGDNEKPLLVVNCDDGIVTIEDAGDGLLGKPRGQVKPLSFADYAQLPKATWATLDSGREE